MQELPGVVADIRSCFADGEHLQVFVDDRAADAALSEAFVRQGWSAGTPTLFLAHVGPVPDVPEPDDLRVDPSTTENELRLWSVSKLQGFGDSDDEPAAADVEREMGYRRAEVAGGTRFLLASVAGEPASIIGIYPEDDRLVFLLATRPAFRHRRIASRLLADELMDARANGCRSVVINGDEDGRPVALYRTLGFTDEVYWRRAYALGR